MPVMVGGDGEGVLAEELDDTDEGVGGFGNDPPGQKLEDRK